MPWSKPALYDLTYYVDTGGTPDLKPHRNDPNSWEDENRPPSAPIPTRKRYRPASY